jgi:hypothetical protein
MSASERAYRIFISLYPRRFLRDYREPMQQAFRDQLREEATHMSRTRLWGRTVLDLIRSAPVAHLDDERRDGMKNLTAMSAYLFCLAAMIFLGRFELHTDDSGVVVFFVLVITFILGCLHPRRAWLWALAGLCVPAADLFWGPSSPDLNHPSGPLMLALFVTSLGLAGSYSGVLLRKIITDKRNA